MQCSAFSSNIRLFSTDGAVNAEVFLGHFVLPQPYSSMEGSSLHQAAVAANCRCGVLLVPAMLIVAGTFSTPGFQRRLVIV